MKTLHIIIISGIALVSIGLVSYTSIGPSSISGGIENVNRNNIENNSINTSTSQPASFSLSNPVLTPNEKQQLIDIAKNQSGIKAWSDQWNVSTINFKGEKTVTGMNWHEAIVFLRLSPSVPAPYQCKTGWIAEVGIDMTTHKVMDSLYPTIQSHECNS